MADMRCLRSTATPYQYSTSPVLPIGPSSNGVEPRCDDFMKLRLWSSGCETRPARAQPARAGNEPCDRRGNGAGQRRSGCAVLGRHERGAGACRPCGAPLGRVPGTPRKAKRKLHSLHLLAQWGFSARVSADAHRRHDGTTHVVFDPLDLVPRRSIAPGSSWTPDCERILAGGVWMMGKSEAVIEVQESSPR
jgi:hypothetical protein